MIEETEDSAYNMRMPCQNCHSKNRTKWENNYNLSGSKCADCKVFWSILIDTVHIPVSFPKYTEEEERRIEAKWKRRKKSIINRRKRIC